MDSPPLDLQWTRPEWIAQAHAWIRRSLATLGRDLSGPIEQFHARLWSTVMRCPTAAGVFYFKACQRPTEARLTQFLGQFQPENFPRLAAVDLERGWMLMHDEGPMLRAYLKTPADLRLVEPSLEIFASLQIALAPQPERFFALGALDRRLEALPQRFEKMLAEPDILRLGFADGLSEDQLRGLRSTLTRYTQMCRRLLESAIPQTLFHDDFHDGNIFVSGEPGHFRYVFSDWDESCVGHPFVSAMLCLRSVGWRAGLPDEATETPEGLPLELVRLRDVYLQPWQRYEGRERLVELFNLAWRVGMVSRALSWRDYVAALDPPARVDLTYIVPAWLQEYLLAMK